MALGSSYQRSSYRSWFFKVNVELKGRFDLSHHTYCYYHQVKRKTASDSDGSILDNLLSDNGYNAISNINKFDDTLCIIGGTKLTELEVDFDDYVISDDKKNLTHPQMLLVVDNPNWTDDE